MIRNYLTFDKFVAEEKELKESLDFATIAPQLFNNGFYLNDKWLEKYTQKNNYTYELNSEDDNYYDIMDSTGEWVGAFHRTTHRFFTDLTLHELHESVELPLEAFDMKVDEAASLNKLQKDYGKVISDMKKLADEYKKDKTNKAVIDKLKELTVQKKKLQMQIDDAVSVLDDQYDESLDERNTWDDVADQMKKNGFNNKMDKDQNAFYSAMNKAMKDLGYSKNKIENLINDEDFPNEVAQIFESTDTITEKKKVVVITTKDGKEHRSEPLEEPAAKALVDKVKKNSSKYVKDAKIEEMLKWDSFNESLDFNQLFEGAASKQVNRKDAEFVLFYQEDARDEKTIDKSYTEYYKNIKDAKKRKTELLKNSDFPEESEIAIATVDSPVAQKLL